MNGHEISDELIQLLNWLQNTLIGIYRTIRPDTVVVIVPKATKHAINLIGRIWMHHDPVMGIYHWTDHDSVEDVFQQWIHFREGRSSPEPCVNWIPFVIWSTRQRSRASGTRRVTTERPCPASPNTPLNPDTGSH